MARKPTSREWFLIAVLAVAGIVALYAGGGGGFNLGGKSGATETEPLSLGEGPQVQLARLDRPAETYDPSARNLFDYWTPPPPPPPKLPARIPPKRVAPPPAPPTPPVRKPPRRASRGPRPPGIGFTYLGHLGPKDDRIAVFEQGDEMMLARTGEVVKKQFRVVGFGYQTVVMGYTDERFKDRTTELPMSPK